MKKPVNTLRIHDKSKNLFLNSEQRELKFFQKKNLLILLNRKTHRLSKKRRFDLL